MTMWRLPIFIWEMVATSLLILMAFPSLAADAAMLFIDRHFGGHVFDAASGGSPDPVPAPVLVLRPPGSLRHDPAVLRRDQ